MPKANQAHDPAMSTDVPRDTTRIRVVAPTDRVCPMEQSRGRITSHEPVVVPNTVYYRRLIADGSLLICEEKGQ